MGRRGEGGKVAVASSNGGVPACSSCRRRLPRSAFPKAELARTGRCRDCVDGIQCCGCQERLPPAAFDAGTAAFGRTSARCKRCCENTQLDRLLQTPKDEVSHFGAFRALRLQRNIEYTLLLVCYRSGLCEPFLLQRIIGFLRVPFIASHNGDHYCEICDEIFPDVAVRPGERVRMATAAALAEWTGCPGDRLSFAEGDTHKVAGLRRTEGSAWFFKAKVSLQNSPGSFVSCWAPVTATCSASCLGPLPRHLASASHMEHEDDIRRGKVLLISRAALDLAKETGEKAGVSLSRFRAGLNIAGRFCRPEDVSRARRLERVRDSEVPSKFVKALAEGREVLWATPEELLRASEEFQSRRRGRDKRAPAHPKRAPRTEDLGGVLEDASTGAPATGELSALVSAATDAVQMRAVDVAEVSPAVSVGLALEI